MTATPPALPLPRIFSAPALGPGVRFRLRPPTAADLDGLQGLWADETVASRMRAPPATREDAWRRLLSYIGHWHACGFGMFAITRLQPGEADDAPGAYVGEAGFFRYHRDMGPDFDDHDEMGWSLLSSLHGKGVAAAATRSALDWADNVRPGRKVCMINVANTPSRTLADRLGFVEFRRAMFKGAEVLLLARPPIARNAAPA